MRSASPISKKEDCCSEGEELPMDIQRVTAGFKQTEETVNMEPSMTDVLNNAEETQQQTTPQSEVKFRARHPRMDNNML